ncbi:hypothetical protein U1Q18_031368 [Sarracenia purpurea var. burkii]
MYGSHWALYLVIGSLVGLVVGSLLGITESTDLAVRSLVWEFRDPSRIMEGGSFQTKPIATFYCSYELIFLPLHLLFLNCDCGSEGYSGGQRKL